MAAPDYILDPNGDVIIALRCSDSPFPLLPFKEVLPAWENPPKKATDEMTEKENKRKREPLEQLVRLQVSSAHLLLRSPYFKKALEGPFIESHATTAGLRHIDAEGWDKDALLLVMRIFHGQNRLVPRNLDLEMLAKVAVIVDYYQCHEVVEPFAEIWHLEIQNSSVPNSIGRDLLLLLFVSWVFRWAERFMVATKIALNKSNGPLSTMGLPIPERIICKDAIMTSLWRSLINTVLAVIDGRRREALTKTRLLLENTLKHFTKRDPDCSEACASLQLGTLWRCLTYQKEFQIHTVRDNGLIGYSIESVVKALEMRAVEITLPEWDNGYGKMKPNRHSCRFGFDSIFRAEMVSLQNLEGLGLESFTPS
ncbi:hypothetical protein F5Y03DRAFT_397659 [Xylaria venustula]|nr:hypothetical protein F5Y03DRAFT_397659 [Xylaria venustula]